MSDQPERRRGIDRRGNWANATTGIARTSGRPMSNPDPAPGTPSEASPSLDRAALWPLLDGLEQTLQRLLQQIQEAKAMIESGCD